MFLLSSCAAHHSLDNSLDYSFVPVRRVDYAKLVRTVFWRISVGDENHVYEISQGIIVC